MGEFQMGVSSKIAHYTQLLTKGSFKYLKQVRHIVENAFGILSSRFRVFMTPIALCPEKVEEIVKACCNLHNYLRDNILSCSVAKDIRDYLCDYFVSKDGELSWQYNMI